MASVNLLALTQEIIYDIGSDVVVTDVTNTEESRRIARLIKSCYEFIEVERNWSHKQRLFNLAAATNANIVELTIPGAVTRIDRIDYKMPISDGSDDNYWRTLTYLEPKRFMDKVSTDDDSDTTLTTVQIIDPDSLFPVTNLDFYVMNDKEPEYWTSFEDKYIYFDSVNTGREANVDATTTRCWGQIQFTIDPTDDTQSIPIPDNDFQYFRSYVFAAAHAKIRQASDPVSTAQARRLRIRAQKEENSLTKRPLREGTNYGRS